MFRLGDPFVRRGRGGRAIAAASTVVPVVYLFTPAGLYPTWPPLTKGRDADVTVFVNQQ